MTGQNPHDVTLIGLLGALLLVGGSLIFLRRGQSRIIRHTEQQEEDMGVVKDTLNAIQADLEEGRDELLAKIDELGKRDHLDADDKAALESLRASAKNLADIVPNAVTEPLPDPVESPTVDGGDEVIDPASPLDEVTPEVETPVADEAPTVGDGEVIDNADGTAVTGSDLEGTAPADEAAADDTEAPADDETTA